MRAHGRVYHTQNIFQKKSTFILRIFFQKINFEKNLTLEIFNFDFLNFDFDYSDFDILDFDFEYFQLHYLLYCTLSSQTGHMDGMAYGHLFVFHDSRYLGVGWTPSNFFLDISKIE